MRAHVVAKGAGGMEKWVGEEATFSYKSLSYLSNLRV